MLSAAPNPCIAAPARSRRAAARGVGLGFFEKGDDVHEPVIPVGRPLLPSADAIAPYLRVLDRSRRYANHGELVRTLEARLTALFGSPAAHTVTAASGTAALTAAILAAVGRATEARPLCLCPAYTFAATALAAEQCGYRVHLVDIDEHTWALDAEALARHELLDRTGIVVTTAAYGRRFSQAAWSRFRERTGVPVVIDAAAAVEALADDASDLIGSVPVVLSLHATKAFGVGEGGAVVGSDPALLRATVAALNFGFDGVRETTGPGLNGKMSEYHAAVGLAELDGWVRKRARLRHVADRYRQAAATRGLRVHTAPAISSCYVLLEAATQVQAHAVQASLRERGIDYRLWYGTGLHREGYFRAHARNPELCQRAGRAHALSG